MFLRTLIAFGMLGLAGCVTTPDYRSSTSGADYYYGNSGYYADDGYYGNDGYYAAGNGAYLGASSRWYGYPGSSWGLGYGAYPGWGMGFGGYGSYGIMPGWNSYWDAGWGGSYWGGYGFSPFYYGNPYWYNTYYYYPPRDPNRRDMSAVRAEQLRQAEYQRGGAGIPQRSEGIRMWAPGRAGTPTRVDARSEAAQEAALRQRQPIRSTPYQGPSQNRDARPNATPRPRYETMPRGIPEANRTEGRQVQPASMPTRSFNSAPRGMPAPRSAPSPQPRAMPAMPTRSMPRTVPVSTPASSGNGSSSRIPHRESQER